MISELDHLVWGTADLDRGRRHTEELFGAETVIGGSHPGVGTRNLLLGLEERFYFEVLAPDPDQSAFTGFGRLVEDLEKDRLVTWAGRSDDLEVLASKVRNVGLVPGEIRDLSRRRPDGSFLRWRLMTLEGHGFGPLVPFFIQWAEDHPTNTLKPVASLETLRLFTERPRELRGILDDLGLGSSRIRVEEASGPGLEARMRRPDGTDFLVG